MFWAWGDCTARQLGERDFAVSLPRLQGDGGGSEMKRFQVKIVHTSTWEFEYPAETIVDATQWVEEIARAMKYFCRPDEQNVSVTEIVDERDGLPNVG